MRRNPLIPIFLIVLVDILGYTIVLPLLPFYAEHFGASPFQVGLMSTIFAFCQLIASPVLGRLSDRFGRKPLLLVSQLGTFAGFLILGFAQTLSVVFLSRLIDGLTAGNLAIAQASISDFTEPRNRAKAFGLIGIAFGLGFLVGPAISGFLSRFGYSTPVFAAAALSAASILATFFLLPQAPRQEGTSASTAASARLRDLGRYLARPGIGRYLQEFTAFAMGFAIYISGLALFLERRIHLPGGAPMGAAEVGYLYAYSGFLGLIVQGVLLGRLVLKFGERKLVLVGMALAALGAFMMGWSDTLLLPVIATTFHAIGTSLIRPALTSLVSQATPRAEQGAIMGLTQSLNSVAQVLGPLVAGGLIDRTWLLAWAAASAICYAGGWVLAAGSPATAPASRPESGISQTP